jgi:light-regulated signal transduction histidine kinase (bacteriophytochrome)
MRADIIHIVRLPELVIFLKGQAVPRRCGERVRACFTIQQPAWALADLVLIREVLHDLLDNAWKFTSGRDDTSIEFGMTPAADARVCCYVRDNGAGFDPAYAHKLFQPFQRLHDTREFSGTGIGLASVRQIVDRHHGRTWAEGTVSNGATFFFTLQATKPAGEPDGFAQRVS